MGGRILAIEQRLLVEQADPAWRRIRALETENARLRRQLAGVRSPLNDINASRQAHCEALKGAIRATLTAAADPDALTAKRILRALERSRFEPLPSVRTVQRHMDALRQRHTSCGVRDSGANCQEL